MVVVTDRGFNWASFGFMCSQFGAAVVGHEEGELRRTWMTCNAVRVSSWSVVLTAIR